MTLTNNFTKATKKAAFNAAKLYFEPISWMFKDSNSKEPVRTSDLPRIVASEVTYADLDHLRSLRELKKKFSKTVEIDISFAKEDHLYAELLKETLESNKIAAHLKKTWTKKTYEGTARDVEVVIWSHNYASKVRDSKIGYTAEQVPYIALRVDKSEFSPLHERAFEQIDASHGSISDAASSLITTLLEIINKDSNLRAKQTLERLRQAKPGGEGREVDGTTN